MKDIDPSEKDRLVGGAIDITREVFHERRRQIVMGGGERDLLDGLDDGLSSCSRDLTSAARSRMAEGDTWAALFAENVGEVLQSLDEAELRAGLVRVATVAVAWVAALDRRAGR